MYKIVRQLTIIIIVAMVYLGYMNIKKCQAMMKAYENRVPQSINKHYNDLGEKRIIYHL